MSTGPIIAADGNGVIADMFVRDITFGVTTIASAATVEPDADVQSPDLSTDGRYLVFASDATNLVPDDSNGVQDIFRRDQQTGEVTFVNVSTLFGLGLPPNGDSRNPSISGDGNVVAFTSDATNYAVDANGAADVFVRNIERGDDHTRQRQFRVCRRQRREHGAGDQRERTLRCVRFDGHEPRSELHGRDEERVCP